MKYFTIFSKNKNNKNYEIFLKSISSLSFVNQKYYEEFNVFCENLEKENIKNYLFANKDIKVKSCDNIDYGFPKYFLDTYKFITCSLFKEPFCYISDKLFIFKNSKIQNNENSFIFLKTYNSYKKLFNIGFEILNKVDHQIDEIKDISIEKINFSIYDTSFLVCKDNFIFDKFFSSLSKINNKSKEIDNYINSLSGYKKSLCSKAITFVLGDFLLSKIINDNNIKCDTLIDSKYKLYIQNPNEYIYFNNDSKLINNKEFIYNLYSKIQDSDYCNINNYISLFLDNDKFISKTSWGQDIKNSFLNEKNSSGGCSSCKLKRLYRKYSEILKGKFE